MTSYDLAGLQKTIVYKQNTIKCQGMIQILNANGSFMEERSTKMSYHEPELPQGDRGTVALAELFRVSPRMNARERPRLSFPGCLLPVGSHCLQTLLVNRA